MVGLKPASCRVGLKTKWFDTPEPRLKGLGFFSGLSQCTTSVPLEHLRADDIIGVLTNIVYVRMNV